MKTEEERLADGRVRRSPRKPEEGLDPEKLRLHETLRQVADLADEVRCLFKPECLVTILVRTPHHPDRDVIVTGDQIEDIEAMVKRAKSRYDVPIL